MMALNRRSVPRSARLEGGCMDFALTPEQTSFRDEVRTWLSRNLPADWSDRMRVGSDVPRPEVYQFLRVWQRKMYDAGFMGLTWPKEYGGRGLTFMEEMILQEEIALAKAPPVLNILAIGMAGPTIIAYGTEEQKKRYPPRMLSCEEIWCQGYSEPNSGSDLASLQTRAVRDGERYVVNGQKVWTSWEADADWCMLLARTDPDAPKHKGISCLLVDMRSPGIEVRPITQAWGPADFNEVFFDDVAVPVGNLLGAENAGWAVAQGTLAAERAVAILEATERLRCNGIEAAVADATAWRLENGEPALDDSAVREQLAARYAEVHVLRHLLNGMIDDIIRGADVSGTSSVIKVFYS